MDGEVFIFLHHKDLKNYYFEKIWFEEQKENLKKAKKKFATKMGKIVFDWTMEKSIVWIYLFSLEKIKEYIAPCRRLIKKILSWF